MCFRKRPKFYFVTICTLRLLASLKRGNACKIFTPNSKDFDRQSWCAQAMAPMRVDLRYTCIMKNVVICLLVKTEPFVILILFEISRNLRPFPITYAYCHTDLRHTAISDTPQTLIENRVDFLCFGASMVEVSHKACAL